MKSVLFVIGDGVYPRKVGGMEIFNFHLIGQLVPYMNVSYAAYWKMEIPGAGFFKTYAIRPVKVFYPLQIFLLLLLHREIKTVVVSFSSAHWIVWYLYRLVFRMLKRKYNVVIHYGKTPPQEHKKTYVRFFKDAQNVIAVSSDIKHNYDKKFGINCILQYPLIPFHLCESSKKTLRSEYDIPVDCNVISMVGSLKKMKNPDTVLHALALMPEEERQNSRILLLYAGNGPEMDNLKSFVSKNQLSDYVRFFGRIPQKEVCKIMKLSDIYLIASDFEGTSVSLLEAMFNGLPVIASRVPGIVDTLDENADCLMFPVKDSEVLLKCIRRCLADKDLAAALGRKACEKYKNNYSFNQMLACYRRILSE